MSFPLNLFPLNHRAYQCCHRQHLDKVGNTRAVESAGSALMRSAKLNIRQVRAFTVAVCGWGGKTGGRILGKIRKTHRRVVLPAFSNSQAALKNNDLMTALREIQKVNGLGQFSYSSKHLRMLDPRICGVFDSVVKEYLKGRLGPRYSKAKVVDLFTDYCDFCRRKADELTKANIALGDYIQPCRGPGGEVQTTTIDKECCWTAADVDMACFAWLQKWCAGCDEKKSEAQNITGPVRGKRPPEVKQRETTQIGHAGVKKLVYLCQNHKKDKAVTLKESCDSRWNLGWICRDHGVLDLKVKGARGTTRYLIGEIAAAGGSFVAKPGYTDAHALGTHCMGGGGYQGGVPFGSVADAVRYLKQYFVVRACRGNRDETQAWINAL